METTSNTEKSVKQSTILLTPEELKEHWQGHRRLTRKAINAFPEEQFFKHSIGGMRTFSELVDEMIRMASGGIEGIATGNWNPGNEPEILDLKTKEAVLQKWDEVTEKIDTLWPQIPPQRFREVDNAFGMYEGTIISHILYFIENEVHHRGQGYVYLRSLGIQPPFFWDRE